MNQIVLLGLLMIVIVVSGCSEQNIGQSVQPISQSRHEVSSQSVNLRTENIVISNYEFSPKSIIIPRGTTVVWTNDDDVEHTIDSDIGNVSSGGISPGETFSVIFTVPRTYRYHSDDIPSMKGTIIVK
jgi:plastocyanin